MPIAIAGDGRDLKPMLRIQRVFDRDVVFSLSGHIQTEDVAELQRLLSLEMPGDGIVLNLRDVTLVDREALKFLARCEVKNIRLAHCPGYIREWIETEISQRSREETDCSGV